MESRHNKFNLRFLNYVSIEQFIFTLDERFDAPMSKNIYTYDFYLFLECKSFMKSNVDISIFQYYNVMCFALT